jgi:hypothetical protein
MESAGVSASGQSRSPRADPRNGLRLIRTSLVLDATVADPSAALAIDLPVVRPHPKVIQAIRFRASAVARVLSRAFKRVTYRHAYFRNFGE